MTSQLVKPRFKRTEAAARSQRQSKWDLIEAIAVDAIEADLPITGIDSCIAAKAALERAGEEYAARTVKHLATVAKFDQESLARHRKLWRTYGWTIVSVFANAGWSQEAAASFLGESRRTHKMVSDLVRPRTGAQPERELDEAWQHWLKDLNKIFMEGARLADRSEREGIELGAHAALAHIIYGRLVERRLDAEIRQLMETGIAHE